MSKRIRIHYNKPDPPNTKRVCRPSRWGNPYKLSNYSLERSLVLYERWIKQRIEDNPDFLEPLRGFNLGCFCKLDERCHADILFENLDNDACLRCEYNDDMSEAAELICNECCCGENNPNWKRKEAN